ncbi:hypothetical protein [Streptomyces iakyrus]
MRRPSLVQLFLHEGGGVLLAPWCEQLRQLADAHTGLVQVVDLEGDVRYLVTTRLATHKV